MFRLLLILLYVLTILSVIFFERKQPNEALMWVLIVSCVPYAGLIFYLAFGSTSAIKMTRYFRSKRLRKNMPLLQSQGEENIGTMSGIDADVARFNYHYNDAPLCAYEKAAFYTSGESHYKQLFTDIEAARQSVYLEFYTIQNDRVGQALLSLLTQKQKQGVEVIVLCDFIANLSTPEALFRPLKQAGGTVKRLKPYVSHFRSHRKIVTVDGEIGYIGGMNIGVQYANGAKIKTPWRDTQVRFTGDCVHALENEFLLDLSTALNGCLFRQSFSSLRLREVKLPGQVKNLCQFVTGGVDNDKESIKMCYMSMIRSAQRQIRIQTPYFIPDCSILDALKTAAASGIKVDIMIPAIKANFFLDPVTNYFAAEMMEYGAHVYKYNGYIHAKTMIVDDELCCIGSVNMDMRSLLVDDEICGVFYENGLVQEYNAIYEEDLQHTKEYVLEEFEKRSIWTKLSERIFMLFTPLM